jgi:hypothetical protein
MNCKGWDCNIPQCAICELERLIVQITKRIQTLESMSTGWKMFTGIKIGYELALDIVRQQDSPVAGARAILETKQLTKER